MILAILSFLGFSFFYSLFEKLKDKKGYTLFLENHLNTKKFGTYFWWFLVILNFVTTLVILISIFSVVTNFYFFSTVLSFKICAATILILLVGQRIAGDFQGAANLGIYMLLTILGWYIEIQ